MKIKHKELDHTTDDTNDSDSFYDSDDISSLNFDGHKENSSNGSSYSESGGSESEKKHKSPEEHLRLLHVYFKDMGFETLLSARDEVIIAAKIKHCEQREKQVKKAIKKLLLMRSENGLNPSELKLVSYRIDSHKSLIKSLGNSIQKFKQRFIRSNLRLVITISRRYMTRGLPLTDLIQEGNMGLMRAVDRFDHTKGFKFSTYASWWINQAIQRAVQEQTRTIKVPVYLLEKANTVYKSRTRLMRTLGRRPTNKEISVESGVSVEVVKKILNSANDAISLDKPVFDTDQTTLIDSVYDKEAAISDSVLAQKSLCEKLEEALSLLKPREEEIIRLRFGIGHNTTYTLDEIGKKFNLTRERIRQIEKVALGKLANSQVKDHLRSFLNNF